MKKEVAETIKEAMEDCGFECEMKTYSGRCMYGTETWSIQGDFSLANILSAVINRADLFVNENGESNIDYVEEFRSDSMGLGVVIY